MQRHTVRITLDREGNPVPVNEDGSQVEINRVVACRDEIRWVSDQGDVEVEFRAGTPFAGGSTRGDSTFRAVADTTATFSYTCTITTPDGHKHGWPANTKGGGTVEVGSGSRT